MLVVSAPAQAVTCGIVCEYLQYPGKVVDSNGVPIAGATVEVVVDPPDSVLAALETNGGTADAYVADTTTTGANGTYIVKISQTSGLMAMLDTTDNTFSLTTSVVSGTYFSSYTVRIKEPTGGVLGLFPVYVVSPPDSTAVDWNDNGNGVPDTNDLGTVSGTNVNLMAVNQQSIPPIGGSGGTTTFYPYSYCYDTSPKTGAQYVPTRKYYNWYTADVKQQRFDTGKYESVAYSWTNTATTQAQIGIEEGIGDVSFKAGLDHALSSSTGGETDVGHNVYGDMTLNYKFLRYQMGCKPVDALGVQVGPIIWTQIYYDYMDYWSSGHNYVKLSNLWACQSKYEQVVGVGNIWLSKATTTTYSAGVAGLGINLEVQSTNDSGHTIQYDASSTTHICGSNNLPTTATVIREVN